MPKRGIVLSLLMATMACTSMQRVDPARFIPAHKPEAVSVWTTPHAVTIVSDPQVVGDTLSGVVVGDRWAVALKDILRVETSLTSPPRTALLVAGAAASAVGVYFLSSGAKSGALPCGQGLSPYQQTELCGGTGP
jgi:hypothetical protein